MPCQFLHFTSLQACQELTVLLQSQYKLIPKNQKISKTQVRKFGAEFNIQHQLPPICYGPPGLPPNIPCGATTPLGGTCRMGIPERGGGK